MPNTCQIVSSWLMACFIHHPALLSIYCYPDRTCAKKLLHREVATWDIPLILKLFYYPFSGLLWHAWCPFGFWAASWRIQKPVSGKPCMTFYVFSGSSLLGIPTHLCCLTRTYCAMTVIRRELQHFTGCIISVVIVVHTIPG